MISSNSCTRSASAMAPKTFEPTTSPFTVAPTRRNWSRPYSRDPDVGLRGCPGSRRSRRRRAGGVDETSPLEKLDRDPASGSNAGVATWGVASPRRRGLSKGRSLSRRSVGRKAHTRPRVIGVRCGDAADTRGGESNAGRGISARHGSSERPSVQITNIDTCGGKTRCERLPPLHPRKSRLRLSNRE
jgi:hypothetical protein